MRLSLPGGRPLSRRELLFLCGGLLAALLLLFILFKPAGDEEGVQLAAALPPTAASQVRPAAPPTPVQPPVAPPAPSVEGLTLRGVLGGGPRGGSAIILFPDGKERLIRVGREVVPGLALKQLGVSHAVLTGPGGDIRLDLGRAGASGRPATAVAATSASASAAAQTQARETLSYRLGLQPVRTGGRVSAFAIKSGAELPRLAAAGLQPGDVIVSVNGSGFDEERMLEFAWQVANSDKTEVVFTRNGKKMTAVIPRS